MGRMARASRIAVQMIGSRRYRNHVIDVIRQHVSAADSSKERLGNEGPTAYEFIRGKKVFFIGGCELTFIKDVFNNLGAVAYHTFDDDRSAFPLTECNDPHSPLWGFEPDYVVLSQIQISRGIVQKTQLSGLTYGWEEQEQDLDMMMRDYGSAVRIIRKKGEDCPIFLCNYPLPYRPSSGVHEYRSCSKGHSLVELLHVYDLALYRLARSYPAAYVLDMKLALQDVGFRDAIEFSDANGIYEHLNRTGAGRVADRLLYQMATVSSDVKRVKCAVFDLDGTLWRGVLREDGPGGVAVRVNYLMVMRLLAARGILLAICSKNDEAEIELLPNLLGKELYEKILIKKVNWEPKSRNVREIAQQLNIGLDSIAIFDDNVRERAEVEANVPEAMVYSDSDILACLNRVEFEPIGQMTPEAQNRTEKYEQEFRRREAQASLPHDDSYSDFLKLCELKATMRRPRDGELSRVFELLQRTNQLNATLRRTSQKELQSMFAATDRYGVFVVRLQDKFGDFGLIGAITVLKSERAWELLELAFSCRAMGRGIEGALIGHVTEQALEHGVSAMRVRCVRTARNRQIIELLDELGFRSAGDDEGVLERQLDSGRVAYPDWLEIVPDTGEDWWSE